MGKLANPNPYLPQRLPRNITDVLKAIIGEDEILVARKYGGLSRTVITLR